jgi:hypothetical protein
VFRWLKSIFQRLPSPSEPVTCHEADWFRNFQEKTWESSARFSFLLEICHHHWANLFRFQPQVINCQLKRCFELQEHTERLPSSPLNPLTPELNPSAQRCLTRFYTGDFVLEPCISLIYAWKTNKYTNYSFSLLIVYGSYFMFRHYIAILRECS